MSLQVLFPYVLALLINDNNEVLLGRRINAEWFSNHYGLLGGKIENNESAKQALARELFEEIGITINEHDAQFAHVMHFYGIDQTPCIALFFVIHSWRGEIENKELHKNAALEWFPLDTLPATMIPRHAKALTLLAEKILYSEDSW